MASDQLDSNFEVAECLALKLLSHPSEHICPTTKYLPFAILSSFLYSYNGPGAALGRCARAGARRQE